MQKHITDKHPKSYRNLEDRRLCRVRLFLVLHVYGANAWRLKAHLLAISSPLIHVASDWSAFSTVYNPAVWQDGWNVFR